MRPPRHSGMRTPITWGAVVFPKIVSLLESQGAGPSDRFVLCEDSCQPTQECALARLSALVTPGKNVCCGAVRAYEQRKITSSDGLVTRTDDTNIMAPAGSKMFVVGIEFLKLWVAFYKVSPTAWSVDYQNQVLVASGHMRVHYPFLAGQLYPHYSHRLHKWQHGDDAKVVPLVDSEKVSVPVVVTPLMDYDPEGPGYLHVRKGEFLLLTSFFFSGSWCGG